MNCPWAKCEREPSHARIEIKKRQHVHSVVIFTSYSLLFSTLHYLRHNLLFIQYYEDHLPPRRTLILDRRLPGRVDAVRQPTRLLHYNKQHHNAYTYPPPAQTPSGIVTLSIPIKEKALKRHPNHPPNLHPSLSMQLSESTSRRQTSLQQSKCWPTPKLAPTWPKSTLDQSNAR